MKRDCCDNGSDKLASGAYKDSSKAYDSIYGKYMETWAKEAPRSVEPWKNAGDPPQTKPFKWGAGGSNQGT